MSAEQTKKQPLFGRMRQALQRTGGALVRGISELFPGQRGLDALTLEEVETLLLSADVGVEATERLIADLKQSDAGLREAEDVFAALRAGMLKILEPVSEPLLIPSSEKPFVILMVGVNGAGKTTTIAKLARRFQDQDLRPMLAAGDTFRAAAVEQLQVWGERHQVPVVAQGTGADSASVVYDALQSATARNYDVLLADTAGRLHTQSNLMEELKKIRRVMGKLDLDAPHETMLVLDAGTGQNALAQAREFHAAVGVSGITLTKLDGTAKGGIVLSIADKLGVPIRFIGVGEQPQDLRPFDAEEFVDALLAH